MTRPDNLQNTKELDAWQIPVDARVIILEEITMKTKCYCVGCKKHPLHNKRNELGKWFTGYHPENFVESKFEVQGADVDCLKPESAAEDYLRLEDFEYPITAYGDGAAITGCALPGITIFANCGNEEHED